MSNPTIQRYHRTERGTYTAPQLVAGWKAVKAVPVGTRCRSSPWSYDPETREQILARLSRMVQDGVNASLPPPVDQERWYDLRRLADTLNNPRAALHPRQFGQAARKIIAARFAHHVSED